MTIEQIQNVCFVGAGTMGCYNAVWAAISGYDVVLYDVNEDSLRQAPQRQLEMAGFLAATGYCAQQDIPAALARIALVADLAQATASADLVSESVFERLDIKREVHRELDRVCPAQTILTTNSSALLVSDIEDVVARGDRFAALHSHMAAPLVDIVGGARTSAATIDILKCYVLSLHGVPLVLKREYPGYVLNAMLGPVLAMSLSLVIEGIASTENVDRAWMRHRAAPIGPFGMLDLFGLDLIHDSWQYRDDEGPISGLRPKVLDLLKPLLERGELGMKSGRGFYQYPEPAYQQVDFLEAAPDREDVYLPLVLALVASAVLVAANEVADPVDIDRAWMAGSSLDTGPFAILEQMGVPEFLALFAAHVAAGRFNPAKAQLVMDYLG